MMPRDFREHEPAMAFDGGPDGLAVVKRALQQARGWLRSGGWIVLEIGAGQGPAALELGRRVGYRQVRVRRDADGDDAMLAAAS
jgi:release factor glutamine methyltransferase